MHFLPLLRKSLKSDDVADLLEHWDVSVTYEFDRLHEGTSDWYWAGFRDLGFQLRFDQNQVLDCIFIYVLESDGFSPVDLSDSDIPVFGSPGGVAAYAAQQGAATSDGRASLEGVVRDWVRVEWNSHSVHYEFRGGELALITVAAA